MNEGGRALILVLQMEKAIHRAKYVVAEPGILLKNAAVHISSSGRISAVEPWKRSHPRTASEIADWGSAVIIPGLINAHAHLELTSLHNQLTQFGSFADWILGLITRRRSWTAEDYRESIEKGIRLSLASGSTLIGDISTCPTSIDSAAYGRPRRVIFEEVLAPAPARAEELLKKVKARLRRAASDPLVEYGISPHAPYTVSPALYRRAAKLARLHRRLLATHVAETRAELQFLQTGGGELGELLSATGGLPSGWRPPKLAPIPYLDSLGVLGRNCLLIHCNYLGRESINIISKTRSNVVYCPRSHAFFGHDQHPVRQLLDSGINVALGTDSLASNSTLSMIDEMRFVFKERKDIAPDEILRAATFSGAAALNCGGRLGRLRRGYRADMTVLEVPPNLNALRLEGQILEGAGECMATVVQGKIAWLRADLLPGALSPAP